MPVKITQHRRAGDWLGLLKQRDSRVLDRFETIYGDGEGVLAMQCQRYQQLVERFCQVFDSQRSAVLVRAPGRVNLIGMHVDHRGGHVNPIATHDVVMVVEPRADDRVVLHNVDARFEESAFAVTEESPSQPIHTAADWECWTREQARRRSGHWADYVKAAFVYLQTRWPDRHLRGFNAVVSGNVPQAAGMASSSAVVVSAAEACVCLNELECTPRELVEWCGQAEWLVGTRGGAGDHAAIKLARRGHLAHIGFHPLEVELVPFPDDYRVVICNTGVASHKAAGARDTFNQRVAACEIGMLLIRQRFPELAPRLEHLRDLNPDHLGGDDADIYEVLLALPERVTRSDIQSVLPGQAALLERLYGTHASPPDGYPVRAVCMFGVAECRRSRIAAERLRVGDVAGFGQLMNLSHDGDRVTRVVDGRREPFQIAMSDAHLRQLIADRRGHEVARREAAAFCRHPGGYRVSCPEGDSLVDIARQVEGVVGARLVGAGLGGVVAVLVVREAAREVIEAVTQQYYVPRGVPTAVGLCVPAEGAGVLSV
jgi:N-acetylgalactosamine kinase